MRAAGRSLALPAAVLGIALLAGCGGSTAGSEPDTAGVRVEDARVKVPANPDVAAGYLTLINTGSRDDTLVGVSTDAAEEVQVHSSEERDGTMTMRERDTVPVEAGGTVVFEEGGLHLMLMKPEKLTAGRHVTLTLEFERGGTTEAEAAVVDPMAEDGGDRKSVV